MSTLILRQLFMFLVLFFGGIAGAVLYQIVYYPVQKRDKDSVLSVIRDLLFWILEALLAAAVLYYGSFGKVTAAGCTGFCLGVLCWKFFMQRKIHILFSRIYGTMKVINEARGKRDEETPQEVEIQEYRRHRYR